MGKSAKKMTWNKYAFVVFALWLMGVLLVIWSPVWFSPPYIRYTYLIRIAISLIWVFVLFAARVLKPTGRRTAIYAVCTLIVIVSSLFWIDMTISLVMTPDNNCQKTSVDGEIVRYECAFAAFSESPYFYVFEGKENSIFVVPVRLNN